jgi:hypothetical protein
MWKTHGFGSSLVIGLGSPGSSWIFTVPLNPGGLLLLPPPLATAGLDAVKTRRARPVRKVRAPDALRIGCLLWIHYPTKKWGYVSGALAGRGCSTEVPARNVLTKAGNPNG